MREFTVREKTKAHTQTRATRCGHPSVMRKATSAVRVLNSRGSTLLDLIMQHCISSGGFLVHYNTTQLCPLIAHFFPASRK